MKGGGKASGAYWHGTWAKLVSALLLPPSYGAASVYHVFISVYHVFISMLYYHLILDLTSITPIRLYASNIYIFKTTAPWRRWWKGRAVSGEADEVKPSHWSTLKSAAAV